MPDRHLPRTGWTRKVQARQGASAAPGASSPSPSIPRGDSRAWQHTRIPGHIPPCSGQPLRLHRPPASLQSRIQGGLSPLHPTLFFQAPYWHPHTLLQELPGTVLLERGTGLAAALGDGKVATIHWETGERDRTRRCHQLTGLPRGIHGASSRGEGLRVPTPSLQPSSPKLRPVLAAFCPRHESPQALGKGNTEFSKPQGQRLPASSRLLICSSICFCRCHLRGRGAGRWELESGARSNPCCPAAAPSAPAPAGPASTAAPPGP